MALEDLKPEQKTCENCSGFGTDECVQCTRSKHPTWGEVADMWTESLDNYAVRADLKIAYLEGDIVELIRQNNNLLIYKDGLLKQIEILTDASTQDAAMRKDIERERDEMRHALTTYMRAGLDSEYLSAAYRRAREILDRVEKGGS